MGLDALRMTRIIHCRPLTTLEKYFQEIGRAGRRVQKANDVLFSNNNDIAKNRKGLSDAMIHFFRNSECCLRLHIMKYFGFHETQFNGPVNECCSNCSH